MKFAPRLVKAATIVSVALVWVQLGCVQMRGQMQGDKFDTPSAPVHPIAAGQDTETPAQRDARMAWWREARFGMFIHWGLYSIPAGTWDGKQIPSLGEWIMNNASIPVADYKALATKFNPTGFSAHDIVALAKSAGMKYIVITAKHHDGFAMFDSKANGFNIAAATPFHRDPLRELAEECRRQGIKLGFYYSQGPGLDRPWSQRHPARRPRPGDASLGQGAGRRLRHVSAYQGDPADQGAAVELRRLPRRGLVRYADGQYDSGARR